ncbi:hypothetical protein ACFV27_34245 [Streptomyces antimycoticus]|uniref:hypothetical protein n=1 Tax=Streptomyces antimycoticus TaxID=68175 RepID=UPI002570C813|nr:hypothetical protein [Streptomyces antimycoticus]WJE00676.1 hypothetical protein QR300_34490 [Streptomyces antimycoticus]
MLKPNIQYADVFTARHPKDKVARLLDGAGGGFEDETTIEGPFTYIDRTRLEVGEEYEVWLRGIQMRQSVWLVRLASVSAVFANAGALKFIKVEPR